MLHIFSYSSHRVVRKERVDILMLCLLPFTKWPIDLRKNSNQRSIKKLVSTKYGTRRVYLRSTLRIPCTLDIARDIFSDSIPRFIFVGILR